MKTSILELTPFCRRVALTPINIPVKNELGKINNPVLVAFHPKNACTKRGKEILKHKLPYQMLNSILPQS